MADATENETPKQQYLQILARMLGNAIAYQEVHKKAMQTESQQDQTFDSVTCQDTKNKNILIDEQALEEDQMPEES